MCIVVAASKNLEVGGFRSASAGVAALAAFGVVGLAAPSYADSTVTVQGTAFPDPARANLSFVGCADLYQRTDERLAPTIGIGPGAAPSGTRSLGWDLAGGNAVGAMFPVDSMVGTTASLAVNAAGRATGVAYAGYQEPADAGTSLLWLGRSELVTPGGAWQTVDATTRVYTWAKYDMTSRERVAPDPGVPTTVAEFVAAHGGDGPGLYTIGFGCDGTPFSMDQLRVGAPGDVTTYDIEGLRTLVSISREHVGRDDEVTITGRLRTMTGDPIPHATMILERRTPGSKVWKPVLVADASERRRARHRAGRRARVLPVALRRAAAGRGQRLDVAAARHPADAADRPADLDSVADAVHPVSHGLTVRPVVTLDPGVDGLDHRVGHRTGQRTGQRVGDRE